MKAMKEKLDQDQKKEDEKNLKLKQARDNNLSVLRRQMQEKEERQRLQRMEDEMFARIIKQKVSEGEMLDEMKKQQIRDILKKNQHRLKEQMVENEEKQRYEILMTEFERKINDEDIEAYQNQDHQLYGKLPGFGGSHDREK